MNNTQPRVSIGMPVYNGAIYLKQALDSLLNQTFPNFEIIISDNGSTDETEKICRAYAARDPRIRYYRNQQNLGAGWNFNRVLELAKSEYFRWACHDDICAPELLQQSVDVLDHNPAVILCYPKTIIIDERGQQAEKYSDGFDLRSPKPHRRYQQYHQLVRYGHGCHPIFGLIRTATLKQTARMGSYPSSDLVLLGELVLHGEFYEIPEELFLKRDHPKTSVRAHRAFRERIAWYDPSKQGKLHLTRWKWFQEYLAAIKRSPISNAEKTRCYLQMLQWSSWNSLWLSKDLTKAIIWPLLQPVLNFNSDQLAKKAQT